VRAAIHRFALIPAVAYPDRRRISGNQRSRCDSITGATSRASPFGRRESPTDRGGAPRNIDAWDGTVQQHGANAFGYAVPRLASCATAGVSAVEA
jgi:hypothetical protein